MLEVKHESTCREGKIRLCGHLSLPMQTEGMGAGTGVIYDMNT